MATQTAAQRRAEAKAAYDVFMAFCPSRTVFETLSDKWVGLVLTALSAGSRRYGELKTEIAGVSPKMLTQTLRTLERSGLVERSVTAQVPVRVDYTLTELGNSLFPLLAAIKRWSEANVEAIRAAEQVYDARSAQRDPEPADPRTADQDHGQLAERPADQHRGMPTEDGFSDDSAALPRPSERHRTLTAAR